MKNKKYFNNNKHFRKDKNFKKSLVTGALVMGILTSATASSTIAAFADDVTVTGGAGTGQSTVTGTVSPITTMDITVPIGGINFAIDTNGDITSQGVVISSNTAVPLKISVLSATALNAGDITDGLSATTNDAPALVPVSTYTNKEWNNLSKADTTSQIALALKQVDVTSDGNTYEAGTALTNATTDPSKVMTPIELGNLSVDSSQNVLGHLESGYTDTVYCGINLETDNQYTNYGKAWVNSDNITFRYLTTLEFSFDDGQ